MGNKIADDRARFTSGRLSGPQLYHTATNSSDYYLLKKKLSTAFPGKNCGGMQQIGLSSNLIQIHYIKKIRLP